MRPESFIAWRHESCEMIPPWIGCTEPNRTVYVFKNAADPRIAEYRTVCSQATTTMTTYLHYIVQKCPFYYLKYNFIEEYALR
jgi:hypothetical protein